MSHSEILDLKMYQSGSTFTKGRVSNSLGRSLYCTDHDRCFWCKTFISRKSDVKRKTKSILESSI